ncbi:MAG: M20/M25/M40 family metallo-hydrolase [Colwelliaceae bacterium]|nr:M20/M25/M40 family metallo-hydrolase [Colwelliaceae bacterium]
MFSTSSRIVLLMIFIIFSKLSYAGNSQGLSKNETLIVSQIKTDLPNTLNELKQAVNINSGSMNFVGVKAVGELMISQFRNIGFDAQWLDGSQFNRAGHVVAQFDSNNPKAKKILMIGHLDTVFAKNDNFQSYQSLSNTEAAGPGIVDMKGGNSIIIAALSALKKTHLLENLSIRVVMTGDEESSGRPLNLSKKAIIDGGKWADIALGFENGDSNIKTAMVARRGYVGWRLNVTGKPAHSSQIFREAVGYGAIYEAARILNAFRVNLSHEENLTFNPGMIAGGTTVDEDRKQSTAISFGKANVIAQKAVVSGDIRALSIQQAERAKVAMHKIVSQSLAHTDAQLIFEAGYPPMSPVKGNHDLLTLYSQTSQDLGYGGVIAANPRKAGAADISFAAEHVDMALDGLGLMGRGGHTKGEVADLTSLQKNIEKAAILLHRLASEK